MRRTLGLVLAVPAALLLAAPSPGTPQEGPEVADRPGAAAVAAAGTTSSAAARISAGAETLGPDGIDDTDGAAGPGASDTADSDGAREGPPVREDGASPPVETTFVVAPAPDEGAVAGSGPVWRYTVEVDPSLDVDLALLAAEVRAALHDPRSWARDRTMQQVAEPSRASIRVVLATPDTVDELCGRVGLDTAGIYSCWNGRFAMLNAWRWENGADGFPDLTTYRTYLVNHEVGHGLGFGHVGCPGDGLLAPVMMQQSKGLESCTANGWPYP